MLKTAILFTGNYRTFDKTYRMIHRNLVEPNKAKIFVFCETDMTTEELTTKVEKLGKECIGKVVAVKSSKTPEYTELLDFLIKTKPALTSEIFRIATEKDNLRWDVNYLYNSGTVIQYYQFLKCYELMEAYEKEHNMKFDICVRTRLDIVIGMKLNLVDFFSKDISDKSDIYIKSMGNEFIQQKFAENKIRPNPNYNYLVDGTKLTLENSIWTLGIEQIWIAKRDIFYQLQTMVYDFGSYINPRHHCSFNSETFFVKHMENLKINHILLESTEDNIFNTSFQGQDTIVFGITGLLSIIR